MTKQITLNNDTREAITAYAGSENRADRAREKALQAMQANGINAAMLDLKDKSNAALHTSIKEAIVSSWPDSKQALLDANTKKLNLGQKAAKKKLQQQLGSRYSKLVGALRKLETPVEPEASKASEASEASEASKTSPEVKIVELINTAIKKAQDSDELPFNAPQAIKHLNAALAVITASTK